MSAPSLCGPRLTVSIGFDSTVSVGSFTFTTGSSLSGSCMNQINFNKDYGNSPKSVVITPTNPAAAAAQEYIDLQLFNRFTVNFIAPPSDTTTYSYNYGVVE